MWKCTNQIVMLILGLIENNSLSTPKTKGKVQSSSFSSSHTGCCNVGGGGGGGRCLGVARGRILSWWASALIPMQCEESVQRPVWQGPWWLDVQCVKPLNPPNLSVNCNLFVPPSPPRVGARDTAEQSSLGHAAPLWHLTSGSVSPWRGLLSAQGGDRGCTKVLYMVSSGWRPAKSHKWPLPTTPRVANAANPRCHAEPRCPQGHDVKPGFSSPAQGLVKVAGWTGCSWVSAGTGARGAWVCVQVRRWARTQQRWSG